MKTPRNIVRKVPGSVTSSDPLMMRMAKALDEPPRALAFSIGVDYADLQVFMDRKERLAGLDEDEIWWSLLAHLDRRLGEIMAARQDLMKHLERDRARQVARLASQPRTQRERPRVTKTASF